MVRKKIGSIKWFSADHHFGHNNIIGYANRPFKTVNHMDEIMIERWNEKVSPEDHAYIAGDLSFYDHEKTAEIVKRLNGKKHLIWGNHDDPKRNKLLKIFDSVYDQVILQISNSIRVKISHFPYINPNESYQDVRHKKFRPYDEGHWLIHGHVHSHWKINKSMRMINVGVDVWDFFPINHDKIISIINESKHENHSLPKKSETA